MASAGSQTLSSSTTSGLTQASSMVTTPALQMLSHSLPIKLDRSNYILGKSQMDNVIFSNGFEDFIEGKSIYPDKETSSDRTILSWIYSSLTPEIMAQIIGHSTSHSAWQALEKIFSSSSRARIMQLRLELQTLKKGSMSMMDYLMKLKGFSNNLIVVGEPISEQDQIMNILAGLGAYYNAVVIAINSRDDTISLEAGHSMLLSYEHRLELQNSVDNVPMVTANLASTSQNRASGRRFNGRRGQGPNAGNNS
ncbi:hypothetical protein UlMin_042408 [Ulmus minor]